MFHSSHLPPVCSLSSIHLYPLWDECAFSTFHTLPGSPPCKPFSDHCHTHPQLQWAATFNHMLAFLCEYLFFYFHLLVFIHLPRKLWAPRVMESWFCIPNIRRDLEIRFPTDEWINKSLMLLFHDFDFIFYIWLFHVYTDYVTMKSSTVHWKEFRLWSWRGLGFQTWVFHVLTVI